ncbi:alpha/beta hydrolase [Nocardioides cavernae]|uniref:Alpha/beta hydrolase n=1 Tax=Nocardioides cavernae TaxID=1921566 RepID=A0ABR8NF42_9ACTN|nr:alpha/beta hydrolase family protein [Nocardioides cavernae]MBD3926754.1 alpha/beta hydrolase [Nocardioides cavernae]MBM7512476.1 pimeloyl-ACP methyl ester carboxylesterase [Nocardioides cavernae]
MSPYVLVHGAFRGGWAWARVRTRLLAAGHDVQAPSLAGAGERAAHHVSGLSTWVDELTDLLVLEDLHDVVLVGHSQGGVVVREVALRVPRRLRRLVYLDAAVPDPGERAVDLGPPPPHPHSLPPRDTLVPARPLEPGGDLDVATAEWINARLTPTPLAPSLDPVADALPDVPATYAFCTGTPATYPSGTTRRRLDERGTGYVLLDAGHDAPLTRPDAVAELLLRAADRTTTIIGTEERTA